MSEKKTEKFQEIGKSYFTKWSIAWGIFFVFAFTLHLFMHLIVGGTISLDPDSNIAVLLSSWMRDSIIVVESITFGGLFTFGAICGGVFSVGGSSIGIISVGGSSLGVISMGGAAVGIIAMGGLSAGIIAIGGQSIGVIAIGGNACGIYALSVERKGKGRYVFSPDRQDTQAVTLFTRWFPKFKETLG